MRLIRAGRDMRVDFFRGLALWWIFTDHIPANWVNQFSLRNFAMCDSAEVFVLLAGYGAGLAYGKSMDRNGWVYAASDTLKRAWTLYIAHIFLFVVFAAQVSYSATTLDRADYLDEIHLDVLGEEPYRAMLEALMLHFQPAYLDILPMYIALLVLFAVVMPLLRWPQLLAVLSFALYATARLAGINLPSITGDGWYFNPLAWQLLFMLGAIMAYLPPEQPSRAVTLLMDWLSAGIVVFGLFMQFGLWEHPELAAHLPARIARSLMAVDKGGLHPFRLMSILALAWIVSRWVPASARWISSRWAAPFVLCGQHSLPVFCAGIFLSFLGRLVLEEADGWWAQIPVNIIGAILLIAVGALAAYYREKGRPAPQRLAGGVTP
ncbi:OpgC domain-containing protein [Acidisphaera sp. L21]|uniref:OpgC domain-containing protein n=1 Tax=Acidisphaera sp. L21 TaxID=1641851 RepID=UPI00131BB491|nr:OpgC domain-containing protein [Acidisphaera sp. L21]